MDMDHLHSQTNEKAASEFELAHERGVILSPREKQLLRRFAVGKSDKVIACEIGGTEQGIRMQRKRLFEKLQIGVTSPTRDIRRSICGVAGTTHKRHRKARR
jgi:DNA-binding CsgD family transcriptional regulator